MNQHQLQIIEYLREENRVLREQLGERRVRFNDDQRRRLAFQGEGLESEAFARSGHACYARDFVGLAPETDRPQI
jgi:hypothetical protein